MLKKKKCTLPKTNIFAPEKMDGFGANGLFSGANGNSFREGPFYHLWLRCFAGSGDV